ncbi:hypothetical protein DSO57_1034903 [Entomophthora muscae]|uniref:Uncharacterized protein n=1 Tax=Entomophthora muscae TaxID=34485 RepID=A0ACC2SPB0_9FUNG|nr:hypothetical protein DSO57_1034903 [Entomophthora muscae]
MMDSNLPYTNADYGEWGIQQPHLLQLHPTVLPYDNIPTKPTHFPDLFVRSSLNDLSPVPEYH